MTIILETALKTALGTVLAASLLSGTAAMAQPGDPNSAHRNSGDQADPKAQRPEDKNDSHSASPGEAIGAPRALSAPQPPAIGHPAVSVVTPVQATPDVSPAVNRTATEPS